MNSNRVKVYLEEMSILGDYEIMDEGNYKDKIEILAEKKGLKIPSKDFSFFRCKYAFTDKENLNGCILPKKEVKKAINTLSGKAIDIDHIRNRTVGYWLDAETENNTIYAYGCLWKENFPEEFLEIKKRFEDKSLAISFEAWGNREFNKDGSYNLTGLEFAGGAILWDTQPAFPGAKVLDLATKRQETLEFAKIIEDGKKDVGSMTVEDMKKEIKDMENKMKNMDDKEKKSEMMMKIKEMRLKIKEMNKGNTNDFIIEEARLLFDYDLNNIARLVYDYKCDVCEALGWQDVLMVDFENSMIKHKCLACESEFMTDMTPETVIKKKGKIPTLPSTAKTEPTIIPEKETKILKEEVSNIMDEFLKKYSKASADELVKFLDVELDTIKATLTTKETELTAKLQELATLKTEKDATVKIVEDSKLLAENAKLEVEKIKAEFSTVKTELDKRLVEEKATIVKARKDEIGEYAKDMKDEDILNDLKFENAKLKKERDEALSKASKVTGLVAGAAIVVKDENVKKREAIQAKAWAGK